MDLKCPSCGARYEREAGLPILLPKGPRFQSSRVIANAYDEIYTAREKVWEDQGRTPEFVAYFAALARRLSNGPILEIGCGEGFVLAALDAHSTAAIDLSVEALRKARQRSAAQLGVAMAECLPFADSSFSLVVSVGVMEHFTDDCRAVQEIRRVVASEGRFVTLIHVEMSRWDRTVQKFREYIFPQFRPRTLAKYLLSKVVKPIHQPIQRNYTVQSAKALLETGGFVVDDVISAHTSPDAPLIGPHVIILVARKKSESPSHL